MSTSKKRRRVAGSLQVTIFSHTTLALALFLLGSGASQCDAQTYTASLSVTFTDPSGAAIPNVSLTLRNSDTNAVRQAVTASDGVYVFSQVLPGTYELTAEARGFRTLTQRAITLLADHASSLNVVMQVGQETQTIEVIGQAPLLDTRSANQSSTLTSTMIAELPTAIHNPFALVLTQAAATNGIMGQLNSTVDQNFSAFSLNGGRSMSSAILVDGAPDTAADWGGLLVAPSTDSVQEMQIIGNTYDAQFGRSGGGVINIVTKGGSGDFHGRGFEFFQGDNLNATNWSSNRAFGDCNTAECNRLKKPEFKLHQFGGDLGGPLWKSKRVYFFGAYEGLRETTPGDSGSRTVPTAAERQGDFSSSYNQDGTLQVLYNPFTTREVSPGQFIRDPFDPSCVGVTFPNTCAGNTIPQTLMDPVGAKVVGLLPNPTKAGDPITHANNFFKTGSGKTVNDKIDTRIDWARSDKYTLFGRFTGRLRQNNFPACFYCNGGDEENGSRDPGFQLTLNNTFTTTTSWVINVLASSGRWVEEQISPALGKLTPASIGLDPKDYDAPLVPGFSIGGYAGIGPFFNQKVRKFPRYTSTLQINATKERGRHSIKFGWVGESDLVNNLDRFSGNFSFDRGLTAGPDPAANADISTTGNGLASLLLGTASSGNSIFNADIASSLRYYGWYAQDDWRATPKLTLNLGVRYEIQPGGTERFNRLVVFDPNVASPLAALTGLPLKGGLEYKSAKDRHAWPTDYRDWAPRLGLAYQITPKLVARAGFGIFFVPASSLFTFDEPGEFWGFSTETDMQTTSGNAFTPGKLLRSPFPNGLTQATGSSQGLLSAIGNSPFQIWPSGPHPTGYKQNWSLDFQYEFKPGTVLDIGYLGFGARKLNFGNPSLNANQLPDQYLSMGNALNAPAPAAVADRLASAMPASSPLSDPTNISQAQLLVPFPQFLGINYARSLPGATDNYNALSIRFTQRFSTGLSLLASYQWSKNLDDASEDQGWAIFSNQWRDFYNRKLEYSVSAHDVPQSFVTSLVYELPVGRGKKYGSNLNSVADKVIGGWQVASIVKLQSGFPFIVNAPGNIGNYGFGRTAPNLVSTKALFPSGFTRTPEHWFNTCTLQADGASKTGCSGNDSVAWVVPQDFQIGNAPRYVSNLRGDWMRNTDLSLSKYFRVTERLRVQFRGDFLNAWNTPFFGNGDGDLANGGPDSFVTSSTFGQIFGTYNSPRTIQGALKVEF